MHREYPHLVVGNTPAMDVEPLQGRRRKTGWLAAASFALLLGAGITATVASGPEPTNAPKTATAKKVDKGKQDAVLLTDPDAKKSTDNATPPAED